MGERASEVDELMLANKVEEMEDEVEKLRNVLQAKEAVLEDVLCCINKLPRHPGNTALIRNVLNSRIKQPESVLDGFECHIAWTALFQEHICLAVEVTNATQQTVFPSCAAFCCSDLSDTTMTIFDDLQTSQRIPPRSKRRLVVSFQKRLLLSGQVTVVQDYEIVNVLSSDVHLALLPLLPSTSRCKQTRIVKCFDNNDEPLRRLCLTNVSDFSLKEGLDLYQCLYTCCFSELLDIAPSRLRSILRETGKFTETDFGDWQLFTGERDTIWNDYVVYVNSSYMDGSPARGRIFAKSESDVRLMAKVLTENDSSLRRNV